MQDIAAEVNPNASNNVNSDDAKKISSVNRQPPSSRIQSLQRSFSGNAQQANATLYAQANVPSPLAASTAPAPAPMQAPAQQMPQQEPLQVAPVESTSIGVQAGPQVSVTTASSTQVATPAIKPLLHTLDLASLTAELEQDEEGRRARIEERDNNGRTPLLAACFSKRWEVAKYLVDKGADVTAKDKVGT